MVFEEHLTQETRIRLGGIYSFWGTQASAFLNAGIAEDTDALSAFRLGGSFRLRVEFPLILHGYNVGENQRTGHPRWAQLVAKT